MEEEDQNHLNPRPTPETLKSDELEPATYHPLAPPPPTRQTRTSKCLVYALLAVVLNSTAFFIFGLVVLRVRAPTLRLSSAAIEGLRYAPPSLNMTIVAGVRLRNTNFGRFVFGGANAVFLLGNASMGTGNIYGGGVGSRESKEMNLSVRVNYYMNSSGDGNDSIWGLRSFAEVRGEVRVLKMMSRRRTALMNCTLDLNLTTHQVLDLLCH